jgi:hypothetical protein
MEQKSIDDDHVENPSDRPRIDNDQMQSRVEHQALAGNLRKYEKTGGKILHVQRTLTMRYQPIVIMTNEPTTLSHTYSSGEPEIRIASGCRSLP